MITTYQANFIVNDEEKSVRMVTKGNFANAYNDLRRLAPDNARGFHVFVVDR